MSDLPPLTILLGPHTFLSLSLNGLVRDNRSHLSRGGLNSLPSRFASPILRAATDDRSAEERKKVFDRDVGQGAAFLSGLNFFGPTHAGMMKGEMFPLAEASLAKLADVAPEARIVFCVDTLPAFFLAAGSEPLETRVRRTSWETLYEICWSDLVVEVKEALPSADVLVLGPFSPADETLNTELFGPAAARLPFPHGLMRRQINETGRNVLDQLVEKDQLTAANRTELFHSFAARPTPDKIVERLEIDKVTQDLLEQRFEEDLNLLHAMPGVRVLP